MASARTRRPRGAVAVAERAALDAASAASATTSAASATASAASATASAAIAASAAMAAAVAAEAATSRLLDVFAGPWFPSLRALSPAQLAQLHAHAATMPTTMRTTATGTTRAAHAGAGGDEEEDAAVVAVAKAVVAELAQRYASAPGARFRADVPDRAMRRRVREWWRTAMPAGAAAAAAGGATPPLRTLQDVLATGAPPSPPGREPFAGLGGDRQREYSWQRSATAVRFGYDSDAPVPTAAQRGWARSTAYEWEAACRADVGRLLRASEQAAFEPRWGHMVRPGPDAPLLERVLWAGVEAEVAEGFARFGHTARVDELIANTLAPTTSATVRRRQEIAHRGAVLLVELALHALLAGRTHLAEHIVDAGFALPTSFANLVAAAVAAGHAELVRRLVAARPPMDPSEASDLANDLRPAVRAALRGDRLDLLSLLHEAGALVWPVLTEWRRFESPFTGTLLTASQVQLIHAREGWGSADLSKLLPSVDAGAVRWALDHNVPIADRRAVVRTLFDTGSRFDLVETRMRRGFGLALVDWVGLALVLQGHGFPFERRDFVDAASTLLRFFCLFCIVQLESLARTAVRVGAAIQRLRGTHDATNDRERDGRGRAGAAPGRRRGGGDDEDEDEDEDEDGPRDGPSPEPPADVPSPRQLSPEMAAAVATLQPVRDRLPTLFAPAIGLVRSRRSVDPRSVPRGGSRLGGLPDLPPSLAWPVTAAGSPMVLLLQLNLAEVRAAAVDAGRADPTSPCPAGPNDLDLLPDRGWLWIFLDVEGDSTDHGIYRSACLYWDGPATELRQTRHPNDAALDDADLAEFATGFATHPLAPRRIVTAHPLDPPPAGFTSAQRDALHTVWHDTGGHTDELGFSLSSINAWRNAERGVQMLGFPDLVQSDVFHYIPNNTVREFADAATAPAPGNANIDSEEEDATDDDAQAPEILGGAAGDVLRSVRRHNARLARLEDAPLRRERRKEWMLLAQVPGDDAVRYYNGDASTYEWHGGVRERDLDLSGRGHSVLYVCMRRSDLAARRFEKHCTVFQFS